MGSNITSTIIFVTEKYLHFKRYQWRAFPRIIRQSSDVPWAQPAGTHCFRLVCLGSATISKYQTGHHGKPSNTHFESVLFFRFISSTKLAIQYQISHCLKEFKCLSFNCCVILPFYEVKIVDLSAHTKASYLSKQISKRIKKKRNWDFTNRPTR